MKDLISSPFFWDWGCGGGGGGGGCWRGVVVARLEREGAEGRGKGEGEGEGECGGCGGGGEGGGEGFHNNPSLALCYNFIYLATVIIYYCHIYLDCAVYLCDFHREQPWERWLSKVANGASAYEAEILCNFRQIAHASSEEEHQEAVKSLQGWEVWQHPDLRHARNWFHSRWLKVHIVVQMCILPIGEKAS